jgi:hypothetical protein
MQKLLTLLPILSEQQFRAACPIAFTSDPSQQVSGKYVFVNTANVVDDLGKLGWFPVKASMRVARINRGASRFSRHQVILQNPDIQIVSENNPQDVMCPSIILTNSHDGTCTFQFRFGIYRAICSNGLIIPEKEFETIRIRHIGYTFDVLREQMNKLVKEIPGRVEIINRMLDRTLTEQEQNEMALRALLIRTGINTEVVAEQPKYSEATIREVLQVRRDGDKGANLWNVFNRVQEAMVRGGFKVEVVGKRANKLRPIKAFEKDMTINQKLFDMALDYVN